jgi:hypothetical protein
MEKCSGEEPTFRLLLELAEKEPSSEIRAMACGNLSEYLEEEHVRAYIEVVRRGLDDGSDEVRLAAAKVLSRIQGIYLIRLMGSVKGLLDEVPKRLAAEKSPDVRRYLVQCIREFAVLSELAKNDPAPAVRLQAVEQLIWFDTADVLKEGESAARKLADDKTTVTWEGKLTTIGEVAKQQLKRIEEERAKNPDQQPAGQKE